MESYDRLNADLIQGGLKTELLGRKILVYKSTPSTNDAAWAYSGNPANNGLCVFAEQQTAGRGRCGSKWLSMPCQSLLCSVLLCEIDFGSEMFTLVCAVAAAEAIRNCCGVDAGIKWPNDIIISGKKAAGILIEARPAKTGTGYVVGIGINCRQDAEFFAKSALPAATSIDIQAAKKTDRNALAAELLNSFDKWLIIAREDKKSAITAWHELSTQLGHRVTVEYNRKRFSGNCIGVDPEHGLILQLEGGGVRMFEAAITTIVYPSG